MPRQGRIRYQIHESRLAWCEPLTAAASILIIIAGLVSWGYAVLGIALLVDNRRFWKQRQRMAAPHVDCHLRACLIIPCKGNDFRLRENLRAFLQQDHPNFEILFVVESADDPALNIIQNSIAEHRFTDARIVIAGRAESCGQKIHNLKHALDQLRDDVQVLVFADSDANPPNIWLRWMVRGVSGQKLGARTGYRWMFPADRALPTMLVCTINNALAAMLGNGQHHLVWGGSWAIRRQVFESTGIREAWNYVVSDDMAASRALRLAKLQVEFEPNCVCASRVAFNWREMLEFLRRQLLIGRWYAPLHWSLTLLFCVVTQVALWGGLWLGVGAIVFDTGVSAWLGGLLILSSIGMYVAGVGRAAIRQNMGRIANPDWREMKQARTFDLLAGPLTALATLGVLLASSIGKTIVWQGIYYHIGAGGRVLLLGRSVAEPDESAGQSDVIPFQTTEQEHLSGSKKVA